MKVRKMSGLAIVLLGAILLVNLFLPVQLPLAGVACAVLLIWAGCCLIKGKRLTFDDADAPEESHRPDAQPQLRRCIGCREVIDLTDTDNLAEYVQVQAVLGSVTVRLPVDAQITLLKSGLVGLVRSPDGQITLLGEEEISCGSRDECAPRLYVEAQALLGEVRFLLG